MWLDSSSSWEVGDTLVKTVALSLHRGAVWRRWNWVAQAWPVCFFPLHSIRDLLHHLPLHMCGQDQLWIVPQSSLHVWNTRRHQSWVWLVHVLCVGRTGPDIAGRLPVHIGSFPIPSPDTHSAQTKAGERLCVIGHINQTPCLILKQWWALFWRHFIPGSWTWKRLLSHVEKAQDSSHSHEHGGLFDLILVPLVLCASLRMNRVSLLEIQKEDTTISSCRIGWFRKKKNTNSG